MHFSQDRPQGLRARIARLIRGGKAAEDSRAVCIDRAIDCRGMMLETLEPRLMLSGVVVGAGAGLVNDVSAYSWSTTQQILVNQPMGQTFTALANNRLASAGMYIEEMNAGLGPDDHSVVFSLYEGIGNTGSLLGSRSIENLPDGFSGMVEADFSDVTLVEGGTYSLMLSNDTNRWGRIVSGNQYAGGSLLTNGLLNTNADAMFFVQWQPEMSVPSVSVEQDTTDWYVTQQIQGSGPIGQTFTAVSDNPLSTVSMHISDMNAPMAPEDHSIVISLYEGDGAGGEFIASRSILDLPDGFNGMVEADFSDVTLAKGDVYSVVVSNDTARWGRRAGNNRYAGGTALYGGLPSATSDAVFRVQWQPDETTAWLANDPAISSFVTHQIQSNSPIGQTFTSISDLPLSTVSMFVVDLNQQAAPDDTSIALSLYEGQGTSGQRLGTREITQLSDGFIGFVEADFSDVTLVSGEAYTIALSNDTPRWGAQTGSNTYTGGTSLLMGSLYSSADALFRVEWQEEAARPLLEYPRLSRTGGIVEQIQSGSPMGQTFTAVSDGPLSSISLHVADMNAHLAPDDTSLTLALYEGIGTGGQLLGRKDFSRLSDGYDGWAKADFGNVTLVEGQVYTVTVENDTARWGLRFDENRYAGGTALYMGSLFPAVDAHFRIDWQPVGQAPQIASLYHEDILVNIHQIQSAGPIGQTFTSISGNRLSSIGVEIVDINDFAAPDDYSIDCSLYEGLGTSGSLLGTRSSQGLADGFSGMAEFDFSQVTVIEGGQYTFVVENDNPRWAIKTGGNQYAGGTSLHGGVLSPGTDSLFRVVWEAEPAVVSKERVFYNNTPWDGGDPAGNAADDGAIDYTVEAFGPGESPTGDNMTATSRGLNGVMIDIANLANPAGLSFQDFEVLFGDEADPGLWLPQSPTVWVRPGEGIVGSDRVTLTFPDGDLVNGWMQVRVLATEVTGLAEDHVFYFGNLAGDLNHDLVVDDTDAREILDHYRLAGTSIEEGDIDADGEVGLSDVRALAGAYGLDLTGFVAPADQSPPLAPPAAPQAPETLQTAVVGSEPEAPADELLSAAAEADGLAVWPQVSVPMPGEGKEPSATLSPRGSSSGRSSQAGLLEIPASPALPGEAIGPAMVPMTLPNPQMLEVDLLAGLTPLEAPSFEAFADFPLPIDPVAQKLPL